MRVYDAGALVASRNFVLQGGTYFMEPYTFTTVTDTLELQIIVDDVRTPRPTHPDPRVPPARDPRGLRRQARPCCVLADFRVTARVWSGNRSKAEDRK
eukprot:1194544-Prorocentrum_minimum.AAC.3